MKEPKGCVALFFAMWLGYLLIVAVFFTVIIYVAWHFIAKYW